MLKPEDHDQFISRVSEMLKNIIGTKRMKLFGHVRWEASKVSIVSIDGECNDQDFAVVVMVYSIDDKFYFHHTEVTDWVDGFVISNQIDFGEWLDEYDQDDVPFTEITTLDEIYASLDKAIASWNSDLMSANWK